MNTASSSALLIRVRGTPAALARCNAGLLSWCAGAARSAAVRVDPRRNATAPAR